MELVCACFFNSPYPQKTLTTRPKQLHFVGLSSLHKAPSSSSTILKDLSPTLSATKAKKLVNNVAREERILHLWF